MRLDHPRIPPLKAGELNDEQRAALVGLSASGEIPNILATLAHDPAALAAFGVWGRHILHVQTVLPPRLREIVILRIGYLCRSGYEFAQHSRIAAGAGLSAEEIARIKLAAEAGWTAGEAALIRACDDIVADHFASDAVWRELLAAYSQAQAMYVVLTASQYVQVSIFLNSFGVQLEPGVALDPDLKKLA